MIRFITVTIAIITMSVAMTGVSLAQEDLIPVEELLDVVEEFLEPPEDYYGPIEVYTAGLTAVDGLFNYYIDETTHRVVLEIDTDQIDHPFLLAETLNQGTGSGLFVAPMMFGEMVFEFRRDGDYIEFVRPNTYITAGEDEPMARAVEMGISDFIFGRTAIEAEDYDYGRIAIDLSTFLLSADDLESWPMNYGIQLWLDYEGTYVTNVQGFPLNDEIDTRILVYGADAAYGGDYTSAQEINVHFSIAEPPAPGYVPRLSDDRVGYFEDISLLYSAETDNAETRYVRYINRWRLEKQDPDAEISDPVEPIVFWLENTIPHEYREAVSAGITFWRDAFEAAGFSNAIVARQMPDDADWDPADIRYNTIRWFVSPTAMYAIGPVRTDPRTGEIYDADIGVNADMVRGPYREYDLTVGPLVDVMDLTAPPGWGNLNGRQVRWDEQTYSVLEELWSPDNRVDYFAAIHAFEGARGAAILRGTNRMEPGSPEEEEYVMEYMTSLIAHEVGHCLGLRHNFAGSSGTSYWHINQEYYTREHGLSQSIMDYTSGNVSPAGAPQGEYWQMYPGDYDVWAIEYGYTEFTAEVPQDEAEQINGIASRAPNYRYATDEDNYGWSRNMDPDTYLWDLSDDPVRYYGDRVLASTQLTETMLEYWSEPGTRPDRIRLAFIYALWDHLLAARAVPRLIGGVRAYRDHVGDPDARPAMIPVSTEEHRRALDFLDQTIWQTDLYQFEPELINMLGQDRRSSFNWSNLVSGTRDFDIHDWIGMIQTEPLYWLYDSMVLQRIVNNGVRTPEGEEVFTLVELFDTVRDSIWKELVAGDPIDSYRRNLQRAHLEMITGIFLDPANGTPEDAVMLARRDLLILQDTVQTLLNSDVADGFDTMTAVHLDECLNRINLVLDAPMSRGGGGSGFMFMY